MRVRFSTLSIFPNGHLSYPGRILRCRLVQFCTPAFHAGIRTSHGLPWVKKIKNRSIVQPSQKSWHTSFSGGNMKTLLSRYKLILIGLLVLACLATAAFVWTNKASQPGTPGGVYAMKPPFAGLADSQEIAAAS